MKRYDIVEVDELSALEKPLSKVTVHGVMTTVSPVKRGKSSNKFFDGFLADVTDKCRVVGFSSCQQNLLGKFAVDRKPVTLQDCEVKQARSGGKMEILLKGSTKIQQSPNKFDVALAEFEDEVPTTITLSELPEKNVYDRVTVKAKARLVSGTIPAGYYKKQDIMIAGSTGIGTVTLWEDDIGLIKNHTNYSFEGFIVREYASKKYLSLSKNGSSIREVGEIVGVVDDELPSDENCICDATIAGVLLLEKYKSYLRCGGRIEPGSTPNGRCSVMTCRMLQREDFCAELQTAKLLFLANSKMESLTVSGTMLREMFANEDVGEEMLIALPKFRSVTYNQDTNAVTSFCFY